MALDTRGSERISNFRWICRECSTATRLFGGYCPHCQWPDDKLRHMDIEVHRAGRTYYAQSTVLLNVPQRRLDSLLSQPEWPAVAAAKYFDFPEVHDRPLTEWGTSGSSAEQQGGLTADELEGLLGRQRAGEMTAEELVREMQAIRERGRSRDTPLTGLVDRLVSRSGVPWPVWQHAGQEMLEAVLPGEVGRPIDVFTRQPPHPAAETANRMGLSRLRLVADYPILTTTFGYSRADYNPRGCRLNPFPPEREYDGKFPLYVDQVQADALLVTLDHQRVRAWLSRLGFSLETPSGTEPAVSEMALFVQLFHQADLNVTFHADRPQLRLVFGLLHTLSHLAVRRAALLCGLEANSLSEYLLPRTLTFALYSNHRFGASIGALSALFEGQSLSEWLVGIRDSRQCVYDPVCREHESSCHACIHLAETSCRHFNVNLSRALLFGGHDPELGNISMGFLDPALGRR